MAATKPTANRGYDIIGDIHGCANTLARLLEQMESDGYLSEINSDSTRVILNQQST